MACVPGCGHPVALADLHTIVTCAVTEAGHRCKNSACGACAAGGREEEWVGEGPLRRTRDDGSEEVLQGPVEIYGFEPYTRCGGAPAPGCTALFCSDDDCYPIHWTAATAPSATPAGRFAGVQGTTARALPASGWFAAAPTSPARFAGLFAAAALWNMALVTCATKSGALSTPPAHSLIATTALNMRAARTA